MARAKSKSSAVASTATKSSVPYPDDFRRDAVRLVTEEHYSFKAAAKAVGVSGRSLRNWYAKFGPTPQACGDGASTDQLREEIKSLRKQLKRAEMEREILKNATAYFARESQ